MSIKKGEEFHCIETVRMKETNEIVYVEGKDYISERDNHITDEAGDKLHYWEEDTWKDYFIKIIDDIPEEPKEDVVNHPSHYTQGKIECIDAMTAAYGKEAVIHFCMCNAFKYMWRFLKKSGSEDIKKAQWYQNKMLELQGKL